MAAARLRGPSASAIPTAPAGTSKVTATTRRREGGFGASKPFITNTIVSLVEGALNNGPDI